MQWENCEKKKRKRDDEKYLACLRLPRLPYLDRWNFFPHLFFNLFSTSHTQRWMMMKKTISLSWFYVSYKFHCTLFKIFYLVSSFWRDNFGRKLGWKLWSFYILIILLLMAVDVCSKFCCADLWQESKWESVNLLKRILRNFLLCNRFFRYLANSWGKFLSFSCLSLVPITTMFEVECPMMMRNFNDKKMMVIVKQSEIQKSRQTHIFPS
jgi:hypothetical protein